MTTEHDAFKKAYQDALQGKSYAPAPGTPAALQKAGEAGAAAAKRS